MTFDWLTALFYKLPFETLDYVVISLNFLIFIFAANIIKRSPKATDESKTRRRTLALRSINLVLFSIYIFTGIVEIAFGFKIEDLQEISQTGLTILIAYILLHYIQGWIIARFGREREIENETIHSESYSSEILGLIALIIVSSVSILVIINIWQLNNWLQATSVLGGILLILFASKEYFLGDMINALVMHYNRSVEPGSVIRVKEFDLTGVVMQITLSQTVIRDLLQKHQIIIPNTKLRNATVETLSNCGSNGYRDFIEFNIGYDQPTEKVITFLEDILVQATEEEAALNKETKARVTVVNNADHAVTWRLTYYVKNPYRILEAKNIINLIALKSSQEQGIGLNTPLTHQVLNNSSN